MTQDEGAELLAFDFGDGRQTSRILTCGWGTHKTWHDLMHTFEHPRSEQFDDEPDGTPAEMSRQSVIVDRWQLWKCRGCGFVLASFSTHESGLDEADDLAGAFETVFPYPERNPQQVPGGRPVRAYKEIPAQIADLYRQIIWAYNANSLVLCSAGLRALLEAICDERVASVGNKPPKGLNAKLTLLKPTVGDSLVEYLRNFDELGNYAVHESVPPDPADVEKAITVIEGVLEIVYDLGQRVKDLHKRVRPNTTNSVSNPNANRDTPPTPSP